MHSYTYSYPCSPVSFIPRTKKTHGREIEAAFGDTDPRYKRIIGFELNTGAKIVAANDTKGGSIAGNIDPSKLREHN
jgi:hypothetical protein